jgi:hypothetical protein
MTRRSSPYFLTSFMSWLSRIRNTSLPKTLAQTLECPVRRWFGPRGWPAGTTPMQVIDFCPVCKCSEHRLIQGCYRKMVWGCLILSREKWRVLKNGGGCFIASFATFENFLLAQVQNLQFYDKSNRTFTSNLCHLHPMRCDAFRVEARHRILLVNRGPYNAALRGHRRTTLVR